MPPAKGSGKYAKSSGKASKSSSKRRRQEVRIQEAPLQRYPSGEDLFIDIADYPAETDCIQFLTNTDELLPEHTFEYLNPIIKSNCAAILEELIGPMGPVYLVLHDSAKRPRLSNFLASKIVVPGTNYGLQAMRIGLKHYAKQLEAFCPAMDANDIDSSFETPASSSEDEAAAAEKTRKAPAANIIHPPPLTKNILQEIRMTSDKLPLLAIQPAPAFPDRLPDSEEETPASQSPPSCPTEDAGEEISQPSAPDKPRQHRRKLRFKAVDFSALDVVVPEASPVLTVIFRTLAKEDDLAKVSPKTICTELMKFGTYTALRDIREGGLAVDFPPDTAQEPLLQLTKLAGIAVSCHLPAAASSCSAVLSGVSPVLTDEEILEDLKTSPPTTITAIRRLARPGQVSWSIKVSFAGTTVPERAMLYGRSRALKPYTERPLICHKCSRYGHSARVCRSTQTCGVCSLEHETASCPNIEKPSCPNCGEKHPANSILCQARRFQEKVCQVRAASKVSHKVARGAVSKAAKSYADAAKAARPDKPAQMPQPGGPAFVPNVAHPRPPTSVGPVDFAALKALFQGLMTILHAAAASGDFAGAIAAAKSLFSQVPGADPGLFTN